MVKENPSVMIIGEKESFLILTLCRKLGEAGYDAFYAKADVNSIAEKWDDAKIIIYYLDAQNKPMQVVMHYLKDKLTESDKSLILVGERNETDEMKKNIGANLIQDVFKRPLQTEELINTLDMYSKSDNNERKKKSILIVDDDSTYLGVIRDWLKDYYKVSMANSGLQALKWLGSNKADLILLDYEMPVTSGPQVLEMLRSESDTAKIPVFFLTGKGDRESVMQVMALKPENYLLKTISKDQLLYKLMEFFSNAG
ncbi:MAG: response regulator [Lachnospiraceae bacterium]|nr:response regulator [Lachnospiraceae bacterium]